jgi:N-acetylglucosamine-6-sulfatase
MRLVLAALLLVLLAAAPAAAAPNVVVIETDDQRADDLAAMPRTRALIGRDGVEFAGAVVSQSECCPSRATFLTGQYAHNHGVRSTRPPYGGFARLEGSETLPVWLRRAGYATGLVGKYLNGYGADDQLLVPPGWTDFEGLLGRFTYRFSDFTLNVDGRLESPAGFQTDALTERSVAFIRRRSGAEPFFLWTNYVAPHSGRPRDLLDPTHLDSTVPAPRHRAAFLGAPLPRPPSFDEPDISDKPPVMRHRPRLKQWRIAALVETRRQRLASLLAVDEGVERIVAALRETGELDDTLVIFTSDNGFMAGEHRVLRGKVLLYEPSIRVPLLMRGPGIPRGARSEQLVWNGDLAPTILDVAGASSPFALDGRSLIPFARGVRQERTVLLEGPPKRRTNGLSRFTGLRTHRYKYIEHVRGAKELYDLRTDPHELDNLAPSPVQRRLARRLDRLRSCAGASCRR